MKTDISGIMPFLKDTELDLPGVEKAHAALLNKTCSGSDFTGWIHLPRTVRNGELSALEKAAEQIRRSSDVLLVIGIGGSYLGARAAYELLGRRENGVELLFAGNTLSTRYLNEITRLLGDRDFSINVVSKSGTTLEPALSFRVFRALLEKKYGVEEANKRIYATTDRAKGALKTAADKNGWQSFIVPDDVGGRFSVLSAVGLLPMAAAGFDIRTVLNEAETAFSQLILPGKDNPAWQYALARDALYRSGKTIEILACYEPSFRMMAEWWKQLYGESEGKNGKGLYPASVEFNADLHSMGQYIQDGPRHLVETVVSFADTPKDLLVPFDSQDTDGLNYTSGHSFAEISCIASAAVREAHMEGNVPNISLEFSGCTEKGFAEMVSFFEYSCALSGAMLGVNPFDQPGVEAYKKNMFRSLEQWKD